MKKIILFVLCLCTLNSVAKEFIVTSPDGRLKAVVVDGITYSVYCDDQLLMKDNQIGLNIQGEGMQTRISSSKKDKGKETLKPILYRQKEIKTEYNTLTLKLKGETSIEFRAYNEGIAYRFVTNRENDFIVDNETAEFNFANDYTAYLPYSTNKKNPMAMAFQATYDVAPLSQCQSALAFLPATVDCQTCKVTLMESDLEAYPGMFVSAKGSSLKGVFAPYPKTTDYYPWRKQLYVTGQESYIAKCKGKRSFPWRVIAISRDDREMPVNNLVYLLASGNRIGETEWIKAGKVAWDWWNDWGLQGVSFKAGINMDTYKHYIDFAAKYGLEYIILDEGWYEPKSGDMLTSIPEINLPELVSYANKKKVGIVLWTVFNVLDDQLDEACKKYSKMGIKGFKVDFLDRDDQTAVEMAYRIAAKCAEHHLLLDYHGVYKPTGINRTFPNIVNFESVFGMEETKWTPHDGKDMPLYDVTFPFIRMQTGFVDFTPGGMRNASKADFQPVYSNPMTMGTRCHQAAMYVIHDSPFTMLADNPSAYEREPEYTRFIASIPTDWDETIIPQGKMGEYIVTARRTGEDWYVAGQTNWNDRKINLKLDFLGAGKYKATILTDGANATKCATDYRLAQKEWTKDVEYLVSMAPGGGFVVHLEKQ